jgi:hypothetical protein
VTAKIDAGHLQMTGEGGFLQEMDSTPNCPRTSDTTKVTDLRLHSDGNSEDLGSRSKGWTRTLLHAIHSPVLTTVENWFWPNFRDGSLYLRRACRSGRAWIVREMIVLVF